MSREYGYSEGQDARADGVGSGGVAAGRWPLRLRGCARRAARHAELSARRQADPAHGGLGGSARRPGRGAQDQGPHRAQSSLAHGRALVGIEAQELAKAFKAGGSIAQLARVHHRTQFALEAQLERQGLWDRAERRPTARVVGDHPPPGTISAYPTATTGYPSSAAIRPSGPAPVPDRRPDAKPQPPFGKVDVHQRLPAGPEPSRFNRDVPATQKPGASAPGSDRLEGAGGDLRPKG